MDNFMFYIYLFLFSNVFWMRKIQCQSFAMNTAHTDGCLWWLLLSWSQSVLKEKLTLCREFSRKIAPKRLVRRTMKSNCDKEPTDNVREEGKKFFFLQAARFLFTFLFLSNWHWLFSRTIFHVVQNQFSIKMNAMRNIFVRSSNQ